MAGLILVALTAGTFLLVVGPGVVVNTASLIAGRPVALTRNAREQIDMTGVTREMRQATLGATTIVLAILGVSALSFLAGAVT